MCCKLSKQIMQFLLRTKLFVWEILRLHHFCLYCYSLFFYHFHRCFCHCHFHFYHLYFVFHYHFCHHLIFFHPCLSVNPSTTLAFLVEIIYLILFFLIII